MGVFLTSRKSRWKGFVHTPQVITVQYFLLAIILSQSIVSSANGNRSSKPSQKPNQESSSKEGCCEVTPSALSSGQLEICPKPSCSIDHCNDEQQSATSKDIFIGGLFPLSSTTSFSKKGRSNLEAACLALEHINRQKYIPGYRLLMYYNDTQVSTNKKRLFARAEQIMKLVFFFLKNVQMSTWGKISVW